MSRRELSQPSPVVITAAVAEDSRSGTPLLEARGEDANHTASKVELIRKKYGTAAKA